MARPSSSLIRRILVTGGNKGIGLAVCQRLLEEYPDVHVILGSRDRQRGSDAVSKLKSVVPDAASRLEMIELDVSDAASVQAAADKVHGSGNQMLYGIVNNAGFVGESLDATLSVNYWGVRYVCDAFMPLLLKWQGDARNRHCPARVVNVGSAAGPNFLAKLSPEAPLRGQLTKPWTVPSVKTLDDIASRTDQPVMADDKMMQYGYSKALLAAYAFLLSRDNPQMIVNTVTPGMIDTDLVRQWGRVAKNPPSKGAIPIVYLLMSEELIRVPRGRFYGSDMKRSPLDVYRSPGDPPYEGPDGP